MRDMREGVCALCAHQEILEVVPAEFGNGDLERTAALTYEKRRVQTRHAALYVSDEALEQDWPSGALHQILWASPFSVQLQQEPREAWRGPLAELHLRLQQQGAQGLCIVALTLCLEDDPRWRALEPLRAFLPRVEGEEAVALLALVREMAGLHGQRLPV